MKNYVKPMVLANEELAESVYMASGDCYTTSARITQRPELGRENYVIQVDCSHNAKDKHHSSERTVIICFNQAVTYVSSEARMATGSGTSTLKLTYTDQYEGRPYHNNAVESIGLGSLVVESAAGLAITKCYSDYCDNACVFYNHPIN